MREAVLFKDGKLDAVKGKIVEFNDQAARGKRVGRLETHGKEHYAL